MTSVIEQHREQLTALCRKYRVKRLEVFGSAARERFDPSRSDIDLLVEFCPIESGAYFDTYSTCLKSFMRCLALLWIWWSSARSAIHISRTLWTKPKSCSMRRDTRALLYGKRRRSNFRFCETRSPGYCRMSSWLR